MEWMSDGGQLSDVSMSWVSFMTKDTLDESIATGEESDMQLAAGIVADQKQVGALKAVFESNKTSHSASSELLNQLSAMISDLEFIRSRTTELNANNDLLSSLSRDLRDQLKTRNRQGEAASCPTSTGEKSIRSATGRGLDQKSRHVSPFQ
jgi:hypothetical protein